MHNFVLFGLIEYMPAGKQASFFTDFLTTRTFLTVPDAAGAVFLKASWR
jgi:hypothetical protein